MDKEIFTILGKKIQRGDTVQLNIDIAKLHTRTAIEVPVIISRGKAPGPIVLLNAGIHGDEVNGIEIVRQLIEKGYNKPEKGTVICIPVLNVFGFLHQTREFPDGRDLNRVFPGSKDGSLGSRFAYFFMKEIIPNIEYCIDFHTGASKRFNFTQLRIEGSDEETLTLSKIFGAPFILLSKELPKSLRSEATKKGIKVLLFEGGKSLNLDRIVTKVGILGTIKVMHYLGLRNFTREIELNEVKSKFENSLILTNSTWIRARYSGMFRSFVSTGKKINKGMVLGSISDPFGEFEKKIIAKTDGYIICSNHSPIVNQGDAIFHIGLI